MTEHSMLTIHSVIINNKWTIQISYIDTLLSLYLEAISCSSDTTIVHLFAMDKCNKMHISSKVLTRNWNWSAAQP